MKAYVIGRYEVDKNGAYKKGQGQNVFEIYTNRELANKAVDYLNEEWRNAFQEKNFQGIYWYAITTYPISKLDYGKLSF